MADLRRKFNNVTQNLTKFLNEDQVNLLQLQEPSKNNKEWSEETIKSALQIRLMVQAKGYEYLRLQKKWPLPSFSTLKSRLQDLHFLPGPNDEILQYLSGVVIEPEVPGSELCWLSWDEAAIEQGVVYDTALKQCLGLVTPELARNEEERNSLAKKVVVFGLKGLSGKWKQVISYGFSGQNIDQAVLWKYLSTLIRKAHDLGFKVRGITNDQGGGAMVWPVLGVSVTEKDVQVRSAHPVTGEPDLIWASDAAHIIKNFWVQLTKGDLRLPADVVEEYSLPSALVSMSHVEELLKEQGKGAKLAPNLTSTHVNPGKFEKMRVGFATYVFSEVVGKAVTFLSDKDIISREVQTTGWFLLQMAQWWKLISNRHIFESLGDDQHFPGRRDFLTKFQRIVDRSHFCDKTSGRFARKPCQNVHKMTTTAMLELHEVCVLNGPLKYLLTSKTLTSYIENLFSQLREGGVQNPNASRTRLMLRLISVGQFLHVNRYSSYEVDPEVHAVDFLKVPSKRACPVAEREENELERDLHEDMADMVFADISDVNLNFVDECGVYYMAGWAVSKIKLNCDTCAAAVRSPVPLEIAPAEWTEKMSWGGLGHPTAIVFNVFCTLEKIITS